MPFCDCHGCTQDNTVFQYGSTAYSPNTKVQFSCLLRQARAALWDVFLPSFPTETELVVVTLW